MQAVQSHIIPVVSMQWSSHHKHQISAELLQYKYCLAQPDINYVVSREARGSTEADLKPAVSAKIPPTAGPMKLPICEAACSQRSAIVQVLQFLLNMALLHLLL